MNDAPLTNDDLLPLLRFRILDRRNCDMESMTSLMGEAADEIERLQRSRDQEHDYANTCWENMQLRNALGWFMANAPEPHASKAESALAALTMKPSSVPPSVEDSDLTSKEIVAALSEYNYWLAGPNNEDESSLVASAAAEIERQQQEIARYENSRVVLTQLVERLQLELEQVRANYALMTAERNLWRDDCDVLTRNRDALEAELKKFVAHSIGPRGAEQMSSNELVCHIEEVVADYDAPKCLVVDCGQPATKDGSWCDKHYNANHIWP